MSSLPSAMRAVILPETGDSSKLQYTESQPLPKLQEGQVLVKNKFSGINYIDTYVRGPSSPPVPRLELMYTSFAPASIPPRPATH